MESVKAGVRSTEFMAVLFAHVIAILSGLSITGGTVDFHANMDLLGQLFSIDMVYIGGRTVVKGGAMVADAIKKPAPATASPPSVEDIAKQVLTQLKGTNP